MPPRQIRVFLPPGSGFTQANIAKLEHVSRMLKNSIFNNAEKNEIRMENLMPILRRVVNAGHYPNMASAARASAKYAARYKKLRNNGRNIGAERNAGAWRKVQNAAGRFRALPGVAEVRKMNHLVANLMKPYALGIASPLRVARKNFKTPPRPRTTRRKTPSPPRARTTRRSVRA